VAPRPRRRRQAASAASVPSQRQPVSRLLCKTHAHPTAHVADHIPPPRVPSRPSSQNHSPPLADFDLYHYSSSPFTTTHATLRRSRLPPHKRIPQNTFVSCLIQFTVHHTRAQAASAHRQRQQQRPRQLLAASAPSQRQPRRQPRVSGDNISAGHHHQHPFAPHVADHPSLRAVRHVPFHKRGPFS
jgi:hypothetical protein